MDHSKFNSDINYINNFINNIIKQQNIILIKKIAKDYGRDESKMLEKYNKGDYD